MRNNLKSRISAFVMAVVLLEFVGSHERKEHPVESQFPLDTFMRINLTSLSSVTGAADLMSIKTIQE